jgi:hypothetical protein
MHTIGGQQLSAIIPVCLGQPDFLGSGIVRHECYLVA